MKVGIAGPVSLQLLARHVDRGEELPAGYQFPAIATLVEEYLQRGHRVSLFALDSSVLAPATFRGESLTVHVGRMRPRHKARDLFSLERSDLVRAMEADPCDIIHAHWTYEFAWAAIDAGQTCLVTAHDAPLAILRLQPDAYRLVRALMAARVCWSGVPMTAVSPYVARHLRRVFGGRQPIAVVPNGLPDTAFHHADERDRSGRTGHLTFATVLTGWSRRKNGKAALLAFQETKARLSGAALAMFGPGYGPGEDAETWARERGLAGSVSFHGAVPHPEVMRRLASEVDVIVHPAVEESFSVVIAEAMALGLPIVAGRRSGGVSYTLEEGKAGILTDVRSPTSLGRAMADLATNYELQRELGEEARASAWRRFRVSVVADQYEAIYQRILGLHQLAKVPTREAVPHANG